MRKTFCLVFLSLLSCITGCGGGGGGSGSGEDSPPTQSTGFAIHLSVGAPPANTVVRSVYSVITIPSNVTVMALNNGSPAVTIYPANTSSTSNITNNQLTITVLSTNGADGLPAGRFATVNCSYTGSAPTFASPVSTVAGGAPGPLNTFDPLDVPVTYSIE